MLVGKFRSLGMEDLPQEFLTENCFINVEFLENKTWEVTAGLYLLSIAEIKDSLGRIGALAAVIINNDILGLIWGNDWT